MVDSESEQFKREESMKDVLEQSSGDITFNNVTFSYDDRKVLQNINFVIPKGKVTAIVGPSGGGKTTILSLIGRFYDPDVGQIVLGHTPADKIHLDEWRDNLSYVSQGSPLLSGTIKENIIYGSTENISDEDIYDAAKDANALECIEKFPEGFHTEVGEMGSKLSGGQRQRIAIARAIIKNPKYLLLDETTSSLDAQTASTIQEGLERLMVNRTTIVVAHNLRTVQNADQILVLDEGKVNGIGTHKQLLETSALYENLVEIQFAKEQQLQW